MKDRVGRGETVTVDRRTALCSIGGAMLGGLALAGNVNAQAGTRYELSVYDAEGSHVGSTVVYDETSLEDYGNRIEFRIKGNSGGDGDHGYVDNLRHPDGDVIEDWSDGGLESYTVSKEPDDGSGSAEVVRGPSSRGERSLELYSGQTWRHLTSTEDRIAVTNGTSVAADLRHEVDNSTTYAMVTGYTVGASPEGEGGIEVDMINPGSQRTAGARVRTPNSEDVVTFTPELESYYTLELTIGEASDEADGDSNGSTDGTNQMQNAGGNDDSNGSTDGANQMPNSDEDDDSDGALPGFGVLAGVGGLAVTSLAAISRRFADE